MRLLKNGFIRQALLGALLASTTLVQAAEPVVTAADLPRIPAVEPKDALGTFEVKKGFHLELAASEPNIVSPVALSIDERGRMFVVEMIDYSERRDETPHLGRIRMLEDTDGDGVYDKSTVFADNLAWPTAVICYDGGIFVGATPDIIYLKDTNGDGKADVREVVFTGFAEGVKRVNVQAMLNSFIWGLDNRIHGATSGNGGMIKSLRHPEAKPLDLHGRDFVIDPRTMTMTSEAGGGQHGLSFDDYGRRFACNNSDHIRLFVYDDRYAGRNPYYAMPAPLVSIAADGPAAEVYRISPEEPWRVIRTRWRIAGLVSGPVEGGGRSAGYFTGATGTTIYRGNAFPVEYWGNAFVGDAGGNLIHRKVLLPDDVGMKAQRGTGEATNEFVASKDTWFRPVQFANAPDGTLYVIDMYRETIEHPWSLPENLKKFLDLNSGNNRGRIYRIVPDGFQRPPPPQLDKASTGELVAALESPNGWLRDTAARLLYEKQDKSVAPLLEKLAIDGKSPVTRIHALYALDGLGALTADQLVKNLSDARPWVRVHAIKLSEQFAAKIPATSPLFMRLKDLATDVSDLSRFQLAFTLGEFSDPSKIKALADIIIRDPRSPWIQAAVLSSLSQGAAEVFADVAGNAKTMSNKAAQEYLRQLASLVGAKNDAAEVGQIVAYISKVTAPDQSLPLTRALGDGLKQAGSSFAKGDPQNSLKPVFDRAGTIANDDKAAEDLRLQAVQLIGLSGAADANTTLLALLDHPASDAVQLASVGTLGRLNDPQLGAELIKRWKGFSARVKSDVLSIMLARPERASALLSAIQANQIPATDLTTAQAKFLRTHGTPAVRELATTVLGAATASQRQSVIDSFQPSLGLTGDAAKGKEIYVQRCSSCHRLGGQGFALGPDLVTVKNTGKDKMLVNIIDPNREVAPQYIAFQIDTKDDESLLGIIANESTASVTVRQAFGKDTVILRPKIKKMQSQGQTLMPEGLEQGLTPQDFANLLEYISTADAGK